MKIVSWPCLSLSQLLEVPSMPRVWALPLQKTLWACSLSLGRGQRFPGLPAVLQVSDGERSRCPELLPPFLVFVIPVPVSGFLQADAPSCGLGLSDPSDLHNRLFNTFLAI